MRKFALLFGFLLLLCVASPQSVAVEPSAITLTPLAALRCHGDADCQDPTNHCSVGRCNKNGRCVQLQRNCTGNSPCGVYSCDPDLGCVFLGPKNCDDGNPCTEDRCSSAGICEHVEKSCATRLKHARTPGACMDAFCDPSTGKCVAKKRSCGPPRDACGERWCDAATNECVERLTDCNDNDFCTEDSCHPTLGCKHRDLGPEDCDDGDPLTADWCDNSRGGCVHELPRRQETPQTFYNAVPEPKLPSPILECTGDDDCRDGDACTEDRCSAGGICLHESPPWGCSCATSRDCPSSDADGLCTFCDRGLCREIATRSAHRCVPVRTTKSSLAWSAQWRHQAERLSQRKLRESVDEPATFLECAEFRNFVDYFEMGLKWVRTPRDFALSGSVRREGVVHGVCSDGNPCTADACSDDGICVHYNKTCSDDNLCTLDSCDPDEIDGCVHVDASGCEPGVTACFPGDGECYPASPTPYFNCTPSDCDDGDAFTADYCNHATGECTNLPPESCDDDDACTFDVFVPTEGCANIPLPCETESTSCIVMNCDPSTGELLLVPRDCNDWNKCTIDECVEGEGCRNSYPVFVPDERSSLSVECVEFTCIEPATGRHEWTPLESGVSCRTEDACHRFACDGRGSCALRPAAGNFCFKAVWNDPERLRAFLTSMLFLALVTVVVVMFLCSLYWDVLATALRGTTAGVHSE